MTRLTKSWKLADHKADLLLVDLVVKVDLVGKADLDKVAVDKVDLAATWER